MGPVQIVRQPLKEDLIDERTLPGTRHARDAGKYPQRNIDVHPVQVVELRAPYLQPVGGLSSLLRYRNELFSAQVLPCDRPLRVDDIFDRADRDQLPAVLARARSDIHDTVGSPHGVLVMFDDDQRISQVPKGSERVQQLLVVPLVQSDRRLVENIGDTHKSRPDLGRETDPLRLSAGQRSRRP